MASTAQTRKRRDGDSSSTPSSSSSTSDSTSTTMFDVTKAAFTMTTTSEEDESSRQVVQGSSSEIQVNVQQDPAAMGVTSQSLPGPSAFNVFLPMGRSVPVMFTDQGICIPGYNAPVAAVETEEEVTTSTTTTEQQQQQAQGAPVAGIFQLLPAGSYLPTFVNMEQLEDEEKECDEDEKPTEEYDEVPEEEGPPVGIVEATVHEREMFVQMQGPLQGETAGTIGWPQLAPPLTFPSLLMPPPMSPPMSPPAPQTGPPPMYASMQAAQSYIPQQYGMLPPFGWQAQMMQSQDLAQAYGQRVLGCQLLVVPGVPQKLSTPVQAAAAATVTEVYPCGHLPQVLQMRETPPSPPPLSPPPHSPPPCPCLAGHGWAPVVVEHKIGIGGNLVAPHLALRKQQGLTPGQPDLDEKGTSEGPFAGPVWGSADGEQEYGDQGSSPVEQSSGVGEYSATGAVLGAAGLVPDASGVPGTVRRSSIETTSKSSANHRLESACDDYDRHWESHLTWTS
ncbi:hypothetical protein HPB49_004526 [Dermacentor silvarum]|uniref:Uncharacterized protein n=1 Tax=Dermacentor silvarum TaxID=543639 RepID=A0ACB8CDH9_DERSI|nr:hypothetical protein HPB49_004526 [Dermacentor silvarum]